MIQTAISSSVFQSSAVRAKIDAQIAGAVSAPSDEDSDSPALRLPTIKSAHWNTFMQARTQMPTLAEFHGYFDLLERLAFAAHYVTYSSDTGVLIQTATTLNTLCVRPLPQYVPPLAAQQIVGVDPSLSFEQRYPAIVTNPPLFARVDAEVTHCMQSDTLTFIADALVDELQALAEKMYRASLLDCFVAREPQASTTPEAAAAARQRAAADLTSFTDTKLHSHMPRLWAAQRRSLPSALWRPPFHRRQSPAPCALPSTSPTPRASCSC
jgi:hypothetical protein